MGISKWYSLTIWLFSGLLWLLPLSAQAQVSIVSSSVSKNPLTAGGIQTSTVTLKSSSSLSNLIVDIRIYDSNNQRIVRKGFDGVHIAAGGSVTLRYDYQSAANLPAGTYNIQVGVWNSSWSTTYLYATREKFSVISGTSTPTASTTTTTMAAVPVGTSPKVATVRSSVSMNPLTAGQIQNASVTLGSATSLSNLIVDIRIYNSSNQMIARKGFDGVSIGAGGTASFQYGFQSSASLPAGTYQVIVGVWSSSWFTYLYDFRDKFSVVSGTYVAPAPAPAPAPTPAPTPTISLNCQENALLYAGPYIVENNWWGKEGVTGYYNQCVGIGGIAGDGSLSARWTWTWGTGPSEIKGYPAIIYGQKPGKASTPGSNLPKRLDLVNTAITSWSTQSTYTGRGHLAYDIWLTSDPHNYGSFPATPITHEIMVAVEPYNTYGLDRNPAWYVEEVTINGIRYKTYKAENFGFPGRYWRFLVFQMLTPMVDGNLDLKPLFAYLKNKGFISGYEYLASIELGTEIEHGTGDVLVKSFKARVD